MLGPSGCVEPTSGPTIGRIRIACSGAAFPLIKAEADSFMRLYAKARVDVVLTGTEAALESLVNRSVDLAALWREPTSDERAIARSVGESLSVFAYAIDGPGILVSDRNSVAALTSEQARALLAGRIANWRDVGGPDLPVTVYAPDSASGIADVAVRDILGGERPAWVRPAGDQTGLPGVLTMDAGGMTVGGIAMARDPLRAVPILLESGGDAMLHPADLVRSRYPWYTKHMLCGRWEVRDLASGFVSFVTSAQGQRIAVAQGYGPATMPSRLVVLGD
jgi:phosphate transport system substrate-binding protein